MKITTGVDIVNIKRIKKSIKNPRFLERVYGKEELSQYRQRGENPNFLAANFAAKEAFAKSLGTGFIGFGLKDVQVLRDKLGAPYFSLSEKAIKQAGGKSFSLSLSHEQDYAIAFVVTWNVGG